MEWIKCCRVSIHSTRKTYSEQYNRIKSDVENGTYTVERINLIDGATYSNEARYLPDGTVTGDGVESGATHNIDFSTLSFTVSGNGNADTSAPVLNSVELVDRTLVAGDILEYTFDVFDELCSYLMYLMISQDNSTDPVITCGRWTAVQLTWTNATCKQHVRRWRVTSQTRRF